MKKPYKPVKKIIITMGDINGIGPEVVVKALSRLYPVKDVIFTIIGDPVVLKYYLKLLKISLPVFDEEIKNDPEKIYFIPAQVELKDSFSLGKISRAVGVKSTAFIKEAINLIKHKKQEGLVTAPISKEAFWRAGNLFPGQTEFISHAFGVKKFVMLMVSGNFRVGFVTTHQPLKKVPDLLNIELIMEKCPVVRDDLRRRFKIRKPRIAIAGLNPHGGENGKLGDEEKRVIIPAVRKLREKGVLIDGPFSSDTMFTDSKIRFYDAFLALYHDQGMIPIKMHSFCKAVNYTAGLPVIRTSPDHGTAFDIAGKGIAEESSMVEAIELAIKLVKSKSSSSPAV